APYIDFKTLLDTPTDQTPGRDEDHGATIEGYVGKVILEHGESCNCGHTGETKADDHIYLFRTRADYENFLSTNDKSGVINIETTPRVKEPAHQAGFDWSTPSFRDLVG